LLQAQSSSHRGKNAPESCRKRILRSSQLRQIKRDTVTCTHDVPFLFVLFCFIVEKDGAVETMSNAERDTPFS